MVSLSMLRAAAPLAILVVPFFIPVSAIEDPTPLQTCFDATGRPLTNNTQCPGSNACCHYLHQCTGNRLCTQDNSPEYVNALCAVNPWQDCSNICQYGANSTGHLPRVTKCADGSYCCDSDRNCCERKRGVFLDGKGNIINTSTSSEISSASSTISASTSDIPTVAASFTSFPTDTPTATPSSAPSSTGLPLAVNVGIGVAVGFSVLSCVILFALYLQRRKRNKARAEAKASTDNDTNPLPSYSEGWPASYRGPLSPKEMSHSPIPQEFEMPNTMRAELAGDVPPYPELYGSEFDSELEKTPPRMI